MPKGTKRGPTSATMSQGLSRRRPRGKTLTALLRKLKLFYRKWLAKRSTWGTIPSPKRVQTRYQKRCRTVAKIILKDYKHGSNIDTNYDLKSMPRQVAKQIMEIKKNDFKTV